jgi:hypothetical protein
MSITRLFAALIMPGSRVRVPPLLSSQASRSEERLESSYLGEPQARVVVRLTKDGEKRQFMIMDGPKDEGPGYVMDVTPVE